VTEQRNEIEELRQTEPSGRDMVLEQTELLDSLRTIEASSVQQKQALSQLETTAIKPMQTQLNKQRQTLTSHEDDIQGVRLQSRNHCHSLQLLLYHLHHPHLYLPYLVSRADSMCVMQVPPCSVDWVVRGIETKWNEGFTQYSEELCFSEMNDPSLRYSFKLGVDANLLASQGHVGVFFIPRRGPNHTDLRWPIANHIRLEVLNVKGGQNSHFRLAEASREFFAEHSPPAMGNIRGRGKAKFLTHEEVRTGEFVMQDAIVVRCTLLESN